MLHWSGLPPERIDSIAAQRANRMPRWRILGSMPLASDGSFLVQAGSLEKLTRHTCRLRAVPTVLLLPPDDQLFRALIVKFCADRQLAIDETVVSYLATRIERSYAAVRQAVELLDTEALRLGRPVTRALAAELWRNA